jgi:hypothetical protein
MYQMKKGGSKSSKQQAAIAISMKAAGKKPKMQKGGEKKPTPTYKNLRMGVANEYYEATGQNKEMTPTALDSANYRRGFERGLKGEKGYPNERNVEKVGRWEGQNAVKKTAPKQQMGGAIKSKTSKMKMGGSLKPVDASKNPGLAKLPTPVRNKMGYKKNGGIVKSKKK